MLNGPSKKFHRVDELDKNPNTAKRTLFASPAMASAPDAFPAMEAEDEDSENTAALEPDDEAAIVLGFLGLSIDNFSFQKRQFFEHLAKILPVEARTFYFQFVAVKKILVAIEDLVTKWTQENVDELRDHILCCTPLLSNSREALLKLGMVFASPDSIKWKEWEEHGKQDAHWKEKCPEILTTNPDDDVAIFDVEQKLIELILQQGIETLKTLKPEQSAQLSINIGMIKNVFDAILNLIQNRSPDIINAKPLPPYSREYWEIYLNQCLNVIEQGSPITQTITVNLLQSLFAALDYIRKNESWRWEKQPYTPTYSAASSSASASCSSSSLCSASASYSCSSSSSSAAL